jgi:hypothetical protein
VSPRAGLNTEVTGTIHCLCRGLNPGRRVCSQTLYDLSEVNEVWRVDLNVIFTTVVNGLGHIFTVGGGLN